MRRITVWLMLALLAGGCGSPAPAASQPAPAANSPATSVPLPTAPPAPTLPPATAAPTASPSDQATAAAVTMEPSAPADACAASGCTPVAPTPAPTAPECVPPASIPPANQVQPTPGAPSGRVAPAPIPSFGYRVVNIYPHDRGAFTEGLQYVGGLLYESTGLNGQSELRRVDLDSGAVQQRCALPAQAFGEGIAVLNGKIYQLSWQNGVGFVYDQASFQLLRSFSYTGEGWGLTTDGQQLIMSDGTATLRWLDPATLQETARVDVYDDHGPVLRLNELEFVDGAILANVWQTDRVARINPQSGAVTGWIDLSGLLSAADRAQPVDVLNGIAYDATGRRLFVTGKNWPKLFEIVLVPAT